MSLESLLALLAGVLREAEVPYMLTGSLAASYHGAPRATQDIDLVVDATTDDLVKVAATLRDSGLYVSDDAIHEAVSSQGMFNAIDPGSGWKIDFIVRKDRPFSIREFDNRSEIQFLGLSLSIAQAEDVILAKLEWAKLGDSERQLRDAAEIAAVQGPALDTIRIERWAEELDVWPQWLRVLELTDVQGESG